MTNLYKKTPFAEAQDSLEASGIYWGKVDCDGANRLLNRSDAGTFLVRDSCNDFYLYTLSLKTENRIVHVRFNFKREQFSLECDLPSVGPRWGLYSPRQFESVLELVDHFFSLRLQPLIWSGGTEKLRLLRPLYKSAPPLQHLCRRRIYEQLKKTATSTKETLLDSDPSLKRFFAYR